MAGLKISAKTLEQVEFMEHLLKQVDHLEAETEKYAALKKNVDTTFSAIIRELTSMRQNAMMRNLGPVADAAGILSIAANRGSQMQRTRTLREGLAAYRQLVERTSKAAIEADARARKQAHDSVETA